MEWVRRSNDFFIRLGADIAKAAPGVERWRVHFVSGMGDFFAGADRTLLVSGIVVIVLAAIFWFSLHGKKDY